MGRRLWVCFYCRIAVRRPTAMMTASCAKCRRPCVCLGYRIRIPPASKPEKWDELHASYYLKRAEREEKERQARVKKIHAIEKTIADFERRPKSRERDQQIKALRKQRNDLLD